MRNNRGIGLGLGVGMGTFPLASYDTDAQAFFNRVTVAGGTLSATEKLATNQLVLDMKSAGIWASMKAIYPMVGASASACAQNLKSSSFTGTFTSGWTFASTGVTPNGTSAFMDTSLIPDASLASNNFSCGYYSNLNIASTSSNTGEIGIFQSALQMLGVSLQRSLNGNNFISDGYGQSILISGNTNSDFFGIESRTSTTSLKLWKNNVLSGTNTSTDLGIRPTISITIGKMNGLFGFSNRRCAFAYVSDGLNDTQAGNFYTAVQTFNTTLSRAVGPQLVSDADAQAYINRVYAAGGTLTNTEATAVNQLTIDMKASNVWTSMKAVYPMIGSSAAACAQNLKSSSFTGTFSSGWTFASTGVTPNGVSAFMNTNLNPTVSINNANDGHLSYYSRTESTGSFVDMGTLDGGTAFDLVIKYSTVAGACINMIDTNVFTYTGTTKGLFVGSQNNTANVRKFFRDNTLIQTQTVAQNSQPNTIISVGARGANFNSLGTNRECAFASIGNGLTDLQASDFYTNVQTFNTTLSRQV